MEMTENERKKAYLKQYQDALRKEKEIQEEIEQIRMDKMYPGSPLSDGMPKGAGGGDMSGYAAKLDELLADLKGQVDKRIAVRLEISRKIEQMPNETESLLLRYRYILGLKWEDIAVRMEYSWKQIHRIHGNALKNFKMT